MSAPRMTEASVDLIIAELKANMATALQNVRTDRNDAAVSTEAVASYYISERARGYQLPAVFVICDEFDFQKDARRANHINGLARIRLSVMLEDQDSIILTRRCWRYASAIHEILDQKELTSADSRVKIAIVITRMAYSDLYVKEGQMEGPFRKEVQLECEVNHWESV